MGAGGPDYCGGSLPDHSSEEKPSGLVHNTSSNSAAGIYDKFVKLIMMDLGLLIAGGFLVVLVVRETMNLSLG